MRYFLIVSVQHCGTWWTIEALRLHPAVGGFCQVRNLQRLLLGEDISTFDRPFSKTRLDPELDGLLAPVDHKFDETLAPPGKIQLLHVHLLHKYSAWREPWTAHSTAMSMVLPTLVPLRDPLMTMISRNNRYPERYPHEDLLGSWLELIRLAHTNPRLVCVPVDQFDGRRFSAAVRRSIDTFDAVEYTFLLNDVEWLNTLSEQSSKMFVNSRGDYDLKREYLKGNFRYVRKVIPEAWERFAAHAVQFREFLEPQGYDNLPWW